MWQRHETTTFFLLTFVISWAIWWPTAVFELDSGVMLTLGTFGPTVAALGLTTAAEGKAGLRDIWRRLWLWRVGLGWHLFSLGGTAVIVLIALWLYRLAAVEQTSISMILHSGI
jgi:hypothetical protein